MSLPQTDVDYLRIRGIPCEVTVENGYTCAVFAGWALPNGLNHSEADLLLRLQPGYPDLAPDMWWFSPALTLADGGVIPATELTEHHLGRTWQRWSRHFQSGQWQSGVDGLESYLALITHELMRCAPEPAR